MEQESGYDLYCFDSCSLHPPCILGLTLEKARNWAKGKHNVDILYVNYSDVIEDPRKETSRVAEFLGGDLDMEGMISAVDKKLYRTKV